MSEKPHIKLKANTDTLSDSWYRYLNTLAVLDCSVVPFWTRYTEGVIQAERWLRSKDKN
jgi:hypothetical protein